MDVIAVTLRNAQEAVFRGQVSLLLEGGQQKQSLREVVNHMPVDYPQKQP